MSVILLHSSLFNTITQGLEILLLGENPLRLLPDVLPLSPQVANRGHILKGDGSISKVSIGWPATSCADNKSSVNNLSRMITIQIVGLVPATENHRAS